MASDAPGAISDGMQGMNIEVLRARAQQTCTAPLQRRRSRDTSCRYSKRPDARAATLDDPILAMGEHALERAMEACPQCSASPSQIVASPPTTSGDPSEPAGAASSGDVKIYFFWDTPEEPVAMYTMKPTEAWRVPMHLMSSFLRVPMQYLTFFSKGVRIDAEQSPGTSRQFIDVVVVVSEEGLIYNLSCQCKVLFEENETLRRDVQSLEARTLDLESKSVAGGGCQRSAMHRRLPLPRSAYHHFCQYFRSKRRKEYHAKLTEIRVNSKPDERQKIMIKMTKFLTEQYAALPDEVKATFQDQQVLDQAEYQETKKRRRK